LGKGFFAAPHPVEKGTRTTFLNESLAQQINLPCVFLEDRAAERMPDKISPGYAKKEGRGKVAFLSQPMLVDGAISPPVLGRRARNSAPSIPEASAVCSFRRCSLQMIFCRDFFLARSRPGCDKSAPLF